MGSRGDLDEGCSSAYNEKWPDSGDVSEAWAIGLPDELDKEPERKSGIRDVSSGM